MRTALVLALLSGVPALVYQVVWTRLVALAVAGQIEAISVVVAAFFGGLALGARVLGGLADRVRKPLLLYGVLEIVAGALALGSPAALAWLGEPPWVAWSDARRLLLAGAGIASVTFLLGGTLPALLRSVASDPLQATRAAGVLVGVNTTGAVLGVLAATLAIPTLGLRLTQGLAGGAAIALGAVAIALGQERARAAEPPETANGRAPSGVLVAAFVAGTATLAFEVLATRAAALQLGSSLYAWALILALFLIGLALGNAAFARRAAHSDDPATWLGSVEVAAALLVLVATAALVPFVATEASGLRPATLLRVALCVVPASFLMGGAFPFFVRIGIRSPERLAGAFGSVSAANTAGGIVGALAAPFVLLETLGLERSLLVCAAGNAALGLAFLLVRPGWTGRARRLVAVAALLALAALPVIRARPPAHAPHVLFVAHGRQATAAVVRHAGRRDLVVDGDPEASTGGNARVTEELLALLPLALHPAPRRLLEIGFGSGITLATAARFPLARVECVEIAGSVLRAARYFEPDNDGVGSGRVPNVEVRHGDGRAFLARHPRSYDVILANTLHPWSLGATGLYSREYFERVHEALRPGGLAAQWLPVERIGTEALATLLRTITSVFPSGDLWWGAGNLIAIGREGPGGTSLRGAFAFPPTATAGLARVGIPSPEALARRRIASFERAREVLGAGAVLSDDRPRLEVLSALGRGREADGSELALVARLARAGADEDPRTGPLALWIESLAARAAGDPERARRREALAERAGLALAREARLARQTAEAAEMLAAGRSQDAERRFRAVLTAAPRHRDARLGLARALLTGGDPERAVREFERVVRDDPQLAGAWNDLGIARRRSGDLAGARAAFERALEADPFSLEALANGGLLALDRDDEAAARAALERLRVLAPLAPSPEQRALHEALAERAAAR